MQKAYLVLSDGSVFEGTQIGASGACVGELVFTTGMCGYVETLTDPSYLGQIVMQTFPMVGNYGVMEADFEGDCALRGYVVRECCTAPSNFRFQYDLDTFLKKQGIPGISGVDTRLLTARIREQGVMNAMICTEVPTNLTALQDYRVEIDAAPVGVKEPMCFPAEGQARYRVAVLDFGAKRSIIKTLCHLGCEVTVLPKNTQDVLAFSPDGLVLSNGPGDPAAYQDAIGQISQLVGKVPIFGIGLGHQLLALAQGGETCKLKYGHRGDNQPVRNLLTGRTFISSQNHGYAVVAESLQEIAQLHYQNANDGTCEGLDYPGKRCFSVQFYPEECAGTRNTQALFERFIQMMGGNI